MILERGKTFPARSRDYVSQSVVLKADRSACPRWSVHLLRSKSRYGGNERRGFTLFLSLGPVRAELGTR
jgi:hypothetical protein